MEILVPTGPSPLMPRVSSCLLNFPCLRVSTGFVDQPLATTVVLHCLSVLIFDQTQMAAALNESPTLEGNVTVNASSKLKMELTTALSSLKQDMLQVFDQNDASWLLHNYLSLSISCFLPDQHTVSGNQALEHLGVSFPRSDSGC